MNRGLSFIHFFILVLVTAMLSGCSTFGDNPLPGYIYTNTKFPYTRDLDNTPLAEIEQGGKIFRITEPFSGYGMYTEIMTNAIGDIAEKNGIQEVYFADMEVFSFLGIFKHNKLYIYGK